MKSSARNRPIWISCPPFGLRSSTAFFPFSALFSCKARPFSEIFRDTSKVFDKVNSNVVLLNFHDLGVTWALYRWIYLLDSRKKALNQIRGYPE